jgi:glycosyltransferase involved in cell wall biosynthesis
MAEELISVIVAQRNSARTIVKCLDALLGQDYPGFEVIVVDDASQDATVALLDGYAARIKVICFASRQGPSAARNKGAAEASGEFIAFTDGDCVPDKNWLSRLAAGFTAEDIAAVGGAQEIPPDELPFGRLTARFFQKLGFVGEYSHKAAGKTREVNHNPSCSVMYRKNIYLNLGGFLGGLWPGEDVEFDRRLKLAGYRIMFEPAAKVCHYRVFDFRSFCRMMLRYGWAQGVLAHKYGIFRKIQLLPLAVILFFVFFAAAPGVFAAAALLILIAAFIWSGWDIGFMAILPPAIFFWNWGFVQGFFEWKKVFPVSFDRQNGKEF